MDFKHNRKAILWKSLSYVLVALVACVVTLALWGKRYSKLTELENLLNRYFVDEVDTVRIEDAAAEAMVDALGDRWSYYIPASEYAEHLAYKKNVYVGVGITIVGREDETGFDITEVAPGGSAQEVGILPGDILIRVDGASAAGLSADALKTLVQGQVGTTVTLTVRRADTELDFVTERREIKTPVAEGVMLAEKIGYVRIANFNTGCAKQTIAAVETLLEQGAQKLVFDVRNNGGGYVNEMIKVLDYLLPEGVLYRDLDYLGKGGERRSDAACVEMPMAVLVNSSSYSAAEFFAACLQEYKWAAVVGTHTTGKGHYQNTLELSDGSAVNLSTGKYFTPAGVNLTEVGGIAPDVVAEVDKETAAKIQSQLLPYEEDPQIRAAVESFTKNQ